MRGDGLEEGAGLVGEGVDGVGVVERFEQQQLRGAAAGADGIDQAAAVLAVGGPVLTAAVRDDRRWRRGRDVQQRTTTRAIGVVGEEFGVVGGIGKIVDAADGDGGLDQIQR